MKENYCPVKNKICKMRVNDTIVVSFIEENRGRKELPEAIKFYSETLFGFLHTCNACRSLTRDVYGTEGGES